MLHPRGEVVVNVTNTPRGKPRHRVQTLATDRPGDEIQRSP
jgi:hypothetical protein